MNWLFLVAGLVIGWLGELVVDYLFWRRRPVADEIGRIEAELNGEINGLQQNLSAVEANLSTKQSEFDTLTTRFQGLEGDLTARNSQLETLQSDYSGLQDRFSELEAALAAKTSDYDAQLVMYSELEGKMGEKTKELDILWDKHSALEKEFKDQKIDLNNRVKLHDELELALQNKIDECESCKEEGESLEVELANLRAELFDAQQTIEELKHIEPAIIDPPQVATGLAAGQRLDDDRSEPESDLSISDSYEIEIELPDAGLLEINNLAASSEIEIDEKDALEFDLADLAFDGQDGPADQNVQAKSAIIEPETARSRFDWTFGLGKWFEGDEREITGSGTPGETVEVYHDDDFVGTASIDKKGRWAFPFAIPAGFALSKLSFLSRDREGKEIEVAGDTDIDTDAGMGDRTDASATISGSNTANKETADPARDIDIEVPQLDTQLAATLPTVDLDSEIDQLEIEQPQLSGTNSPDLATVDLQTGISALELNLPELDPEVSLDAPERIDLSAQSGQLEVESPQVTLDFDWPTVDMSKPAAGVEIETPQVELNLDEESDPISKAADGAGLDSGSTPDLDVDLPEADFEPSQLSIDAPEIEVDLDMTAEAEVEATTPAAELGTEELENSRDDFTRIWGIGPKIDALLYEKGYTTYAQLGEISPEDVNGTIKESRVPKSRIPADPHTVWTTQANLAAAGDWDGVSTFIQGNRRDDLKLIWGIGPKVEGLLNAKGVYTFEKLSKMTPEAVSAIINEAGTRFVLSPDKLHSSWIEQALVANTEDWDEFNRIKKSLSWKKVN